MFTRQQLHLHWASVGQRWICDRPGYYLDCVGLTWLGARCVDFTYPLYQWFSARQASWVRSHV